MKKWLLTTFSVLFLVGCTDDQTVTPKTTVDNQDQVIGSTASKENTGTEDADTEKIDTSVEDAQEVTEKIDTGAVASQETVEKINTRAQTLNLENYDEYQTLSEKIDLTIYQAEYVTDSPGKRILLFTDADGRKIYKSIFIKHDRYLKIIHLDGEGLLYNNQI